MLPRTMDAVTRWELAGTRTTVFGHDIFVRDTGFQREPGDPIVILHGFPSCSFDWRRIVDGLAGVRRIVLFDMLGYGLSDKPDQRYSLFEQADIAQALIESLDLNRCVLVTHDMGDSVGGELCARALDGTLPFDITSRVVTNGSIYMDLVQLSAGQQVLLGLPDEALPDESAPGADLFKASLAATFARPPDDEELEAQWLLLASCGGDRILSRLIHYIEERRIHEGRWTSAIEKHPSPISIVWGDADPIAVFAMAERLAESRPDAGLTRLDGIGHYPMIEAPEQVVDALLAHLYRM